jgi:hypothetical protein
MKAIAFLTMLIAFNVQAQVTERWICKDAYTSAWTTIVTAEVLESKFSGLVMVAGTEHEARYQVKGFNRRWDFGLTDDDTYDYAFILKPNGDGIYYDFSSAAAGEVVQPSQFLTCQQSKLKSGA